jgi:hypothetical protein
LHNAKGASFSGMKAYFPGIAMTSPTLGAFIHRHKLRPLVVQRLTMLNPAHIIHGAWIRPSASASSWLATAGKSNDEGTSCAESWAGGLRFS